MQTVQEKNMWRPDMYDINPAGGRFLWSGKAFATSGREVIRKA